MGRDRGVTWVDRSREVVVHRGERQGVPVGVGVVLPGSPWKHRRSKPASTHTSCAKDSLFQTDVSRPRHSNPLSSPPTRQPGKQASKYTPNPRPYSPPLRTRPCHPIQASMPTHHHHPPPSSQNPEKPPQHLQPYILSFPTRNSTTPQDGYSRGVKRKERRRVLYCSPCCAWRYLYAPKARAAPMRTMA